MIYASFEILLESFLILEDVIKLIGVVCIWYGYDIMLINIFAMILSWQISNKSASLPKIH